MSAFDDELSEDPSLVIRDAHGHLVRAAPADAEDLRRTVRLYVNGAMREVALARPETDAFGNQRRDARGLISLRYTTLLDVLPEDQRPPTLCHQDHLTPVGVCRVCYIPVKSVRPGKGQPPAAEPPRDARSALHPACCTELKRICEPRPDGTQDHVWVFTPSSSEYQKQVLPRVSVLLGLLRARHRHPGADDRGGRYRNELDVLDERLRGLAPEPDEGTRSQPAFSAHEVPHDPALVEPRAATAAVRVDLNNCILCGRCVRGCSEVRGFHVLGLNGKGHETQVGFHGRPAVPARIAPERVAIGSPAAEAAGPRVRLPVARSACVSCGECFVSCPTGALTFNEEVTDRRVVGRHLSPDEIRQSGIPLFAQLPWNYLRWNRGSVAERTFLVDTVLCRQGEYGASAFVIREGTLVIRQETSEGREPVTFERTPADVIVGEMSLMNNDRRSATVQALAGSVVWEVGRDVFLMLQRSRSAREQLDRIYLRRALEGALDGGRLPLTGSGAWLFAGLDDNLRRACLDFLLNQPLELIRLEPGQLMLQQGDSIQGSADQRDGMYLIRSGFVKVTRGTTTTPETVIDCLGPGRHFGEVALLAMHSEVVREHLPGGVASAGHRTSTCRALDHAELVYIPGHGFRALLDALPRVAEVFITDCVNLLRRNERVLRQPDDRLGEYVRQGLYQGQDLLLIDLTRCTRCQECVRACADSHGGTTRLVLEGERFDRYLVPSSCRSCRDPLCLVGCPVDAIHREGDQVSILIDEKRCTGCGLCARNCPYGSIHMAPKKGGGLLATNCDLCKEDNGDYQCVRHCPHDAAHRMDGVTGLPARVGLWPLNDPGQRPGGRRS